MLMNDARGAAGAPDAERAAGGVGRWLLVANVVVLALQPMLLIFLLFGTGAMMEVPVWGRGVVLTWAFFIPLWAVMGPLRGPQPARWQRTGFLLTSFAIPVASAVWWGDSVAQVLLDLASYNTLGASIAVGLTMVAGPFVEVRFDGRRVEGVRMRTGSEIRELLNPLPVMLFVSALLIFIMVVGPLGAEIGFIRSSDRGVVSLLFRYASLAGEVVVIGSMFLGQSIYAPRPAPAAPRPSRSDAVPPAPRYARHPGPSSQVPLQGAVT